MATLMVTQLQLLKPAINFSTNTLMIDDSYASILQLPLNLTRHTLQAFLELSIDCKYDIFQLKDHLRDPDKCNQINEWCR